MDYKCLSIHYLNNMATIDELQTAIDAHTKAMKDLNEKLEALKTASDMHVLTEDQIKQRVAELSDDALWKHFVNNTVVVDNVTSVAEDCRNHFRREGDKESTNSKVGKLDTRKWQNFLIKLIDRLRETNKFKDGLRWYPFSYSVDEPNCDYDTIISAGQYVLYGN
jgi:hypothetical protein